MRKMFSEKQIKKMSIEGVATGLGDNEPSLYQGIVNNVNDGISSGDIVAGGKAYLHRIKIYTGFNYPYISYFHIYSSSTTPFTDQTLAKWLYDHNFRSVTTKFYPVEHNEPQLEASNAILTIKTDAGIYSSNGTHINGKWTENKFSFTITDGAITISFSGGSEPSYYMTTVTDTVIVE